MTKKRGYLFLISVGVLVLWLRASNGGRAEASDGAPPVPAGDSLTLVKVEPIVVNLNDEDEVHFLKTSLELQTATVKNGELLTARMAIVRNEMILHLSSLTLVDTRGEKLKVELLKKIGERLNHALGSDLVQRAYFTEFVVQ